MAEYVVSSKDGRPMFVAEAPNIGAINVALLRHWRGFDGTIKPLSEAKTEITAQETRQREQRERLVKAFGRLGVSESAALRGISESRRSGLDALPHYRLPAPSSSSSGSHLLSERTVGAPSAPSAQTVELRERAVRALGRLGVSEEVALRGL